MSGFEDRKEYAKGQLDDRDIREVGKALERWLEEAKEADPSDYNAMTLSTVGRDGHPNARVVLLRSVAHTEDGPAVVFYTNYNSIKGQELGGHPHAAATFFWRELERQLRIRGRVMRLSEAESDRYFASRPRESQIGAWASQQSATAEDRAAMDAAWKKYDAQFPDDVPRPPHWGGYMLKVYAIEFWQGRPGRMHDRLVAERTENGWSISRLQP